MDIDKKQLKTAGNYAEALFKIGQEQNSVDKLYTQLKSVTEIINSSKELKKFFENPLVSANDKKEIVFKIFGKDFDLQIINILNVLADNKRMNILNTILYCFENMYENVKNISKVKIISAVEMNTESKNRIIKILTEKLNQKIIPEYKIQSNIIGGLIIKVQDKIIDLSLNTKINNMEKQLI